MDSCYRFHPLVGAVEREELRLFYHRLRRALRAAHGLRIPLELSWSSGRTNPIILGPGPAHGDRWLHFGLSAAYAPGQWRRVEAAELRLDGAPIHALRCGESAELPFPSPTEESPWSDTVVDHLASSRPGIAVLWSLTPDSLPRSAETDTPRATPHDERTPPRSLGTAARTLEDRREARRWAPRWRVNGRILSRTDAASRASAAQVAALIEATSRLDGGNRIIGVRPGRFPSLLTYDVILTEPELAALFPAPVAARKPAGLGEPPAPRPLWLGRDFRGSLVGLPIDPSDGRHLLILGETGMGKSSLLTRLAWLAARRGAVVLFDPVGETAETFVRGIPSRGYPVARLGPDRPQLALNILGEVSAGGTRSGVASDRLLGDVISALRRVRAGRYADSSFWGPRLEEMLFHALRTASLWPEPSLERAEELLARGAPMIRAVPERAREAVGELRRRLDLTPQDGEGARRLLSEITRSEALRSLLDANSPTWSARQAVAPGQLTIVSGDAPVAGESVARYFLAVVLALVWNAVLGRSEPTKLFLVLDEVQWYAHESVAEMLRLGRRFNIHVWAATQSFESIPPGLQEAFRTNVADLVLFRGDPAGLREIARWAPEVRPDQVMRMARGNAAVLIGKGSDVRWLDLPRPRVPTHSAPADGRNQPARSVPAPPETLRGAGPGATQAGPPTPIHETFWTALEESAKDTGHTSEFRIGLTALRARCSTDPAVAEQLVRAGGRLLKAQGAILQSGRDEGGAYWIVSTDRTLQMLAERRSTPDGPAVSDEEGSGAVR